MRENDTKNRAPAQPLRILVVEDDAGLSRLVQKNLQRQGYTVEIADDGEQGLAMCATTEYDLVIVDYDLPGLDGLEVINKLATKDDTNPTIMMVTGQGSEAVAVKAMKLGASDYLVKDSDGLFIKILPMVLKKAIDQSRLARDKARAEEELARLAAILETTTDIVATATSEEQVTYMNRVGRQVFGWPKGSQAREVGQFHPQWAHEVIRDHGIPRAIAEGVWKGETAVVDAAGREIPTSQVIMAHKTAAGEVEYMSTILRDISQTKRAEEERLIVQRKLQHLQKRESLAVLAGGIAHDFNNLLMAILGNAELALLDMTPTSSGRECLTEITKAVQRAGELTNQMLAYSGKGRYLVENIDLNRVVGETANLAEVSIAQKASLELDLKTDLPLIKADGAQIRQVLMNLITNASEAVTGSDDLITVKTGAKECDRAYLEVTDLVRAWHDEPLPEGTYVFFQISDTGCGMDSETMEKIFDPFYSTRFTGRGLGMAAVLGIVQAHDGAIEITSEPGKGSTFRVLFPAAAEPGVAKEAPEPAAEESEWQGSGTILVVDDEESVRAVATRTLQRLGYTILTAAGGHEAIKIYREHSEAIACVLLDLTMPHLDGGETLIELRRIQPDVKVILSSGYSERDVVHRFAGLDFAWFVQKPYVTATLQAKLKQVLGPGPGSAGSL